ncbi:hypothetical protein GCM10009836_73230 [Pseudonocardia ailaonensis]|uniref:AB hydrolase-1 domain-containing protein n=1 Tax=Pseudonocardia ailaonensis TaxID=367279 RepID=A0ABN2NRV4_9PSEU
MATALTPRPLASFVRRAAHLLPGVPTADVDGMTYAVESFAEPGARHAFVQTVRSTLSWSGQRLDGTGRLYLLADVPVLLVAGTTDAVIPVAHSLAAHEQLPGSRLEIFDGTGHFPHSEHPQRFARVLLDFLRTTPATRGDLASLRSRLHWADRGDGTTTATLSPV